MYCPRVWAGYLERIKLIIKGLVDLLIGAARVGKHGPWKSGRLTYKAIRCLIARTRKAAFVEKRVTPHTTRHTALTWLLDSGADLKTVQEIAGHANIRTTEPIPPYQR